MYIFLPDVLLSETACGISPLLVNKMIYHTEIPNSSFDMISITYSLRHTKNAPNLFFINRIFCISETGICIEIISTIPETS